MIDPAGHLAGVRQQQVKRSRGDPPLNILEVPITDDDDPQHQRQKPCQGNTPSHAALDVRTRIGPQPVGLVGRCRRGIGEAGQIVEYDVARAANRGSLLFGQYMFQPIRRVRSQKVG